MLGYVGNELFAFYKFYRSIEVKEVKKRPRRPRRTPAGGVQPEAYPHSQI